MSRQEISKVRVAGSLRWLLIKGRMSTAEALRENFLLRDARRGGIFMWISQLPSTNAKALFSQKNPVEHACRMKKALYFIFSLTSSGILSIFIFFEIQLHMDDNGLHHKNTGWIRESRVNCWASHLLQWWKIYVLLY